MKRIIFIIIAVIILGVFVGALNSSKGKKWLQEQSVVDSSVRTGCETQVAGPNEDIVTMEGRRFKITDSDVFACRAGKWEFQSSIQQPNFKDIRIKKNSSGCEMENTKTGEQITFANNFSNGFEAPTFLDLFKDDNGTNFTALSPWTNFTSLAPKTPTLESYVKLRKQVMLAGESFQDNRVDLETKNPHTGKSAARFYSVNPQPAIKVGKAMVEREFFCFSKGDDLWFSGWFYLEKGTPSTFVDFNTAKFMERPGIRLFLRQKYAAQYATMELKWAHKPQYNQFNVPLPRKKWFNIKIHLKLSNHEDGLIEVWQDGTKIISTNGQTLPTYDTIYSVFLVGITATSEETVLLVDDVVISDKPIME